MRQACVPHDESADCTSGNEPVPRPLIFNRSKAHPLTRTLQLVNPGHARNSGASWTPSSPPPPTPWGPGRAGCSRPALMRLAVSPEAAGGVGGLRESSPGGPLLLQDTLLTAESKACTRDPNGFSFWGAAF